MASRRDSATCAPAAHGMPSHGASGTLPPLACFSVRTQALRLRIESWQAESRSAGQPPAAHSPVQCVLQLDPLGAVRLAGAHPWVFGAASGGGTMLRHKNVAFPLGVITQTPYRFAGNHDSERPHHLSPCRSCTHRPRTCMIVIPLRSVMYNMYHRQRFTLGQTQHVPTVR